MKMKTRTSKLFALAIVMLAFTASTFAQVGATSNVTATIITPIGITRTAHMNFGSAAVLAGSGGTLVLATDGTRSVTGGVTAVTSGAGTAAAFNVTGANNATYSITLTGTPVTVDDGATHQMTVNTFVTSPTPTGTLSALGAQTLLVGATLNVAAAQAPGVYTQLAPFTVTVNYN